MQGLEGVALILRWERWHARPCSATPGGKETLEGPVTKDRVVNKRCSFLKKTPTRKKEERNKEKKDIMIDMYWLEGLSYPLK